MRPHTNMSATTRALTVAAALLPLLLASCADNTSLQGQDAIVTLAVGSTATRSNPPKGALLKFQPKFSPEVRFTTNAAASLVFNAQSSLVLVTGSLNGVKGVFALDSLAPRSAITPAFLDKALPSPRTMYPVDHIANGVTQQLDCVPIFSFLLGSATFTDFDMVVTPGDRLTSDTAPAIDGVLGANILFAAPLVLDCWHRTLHVVPAAPTGQWHSARISFTPGVPTIPVTIDGALTLCVFDFRSPYSWLHAASYSGKTSEGRATPASIQFSNVPVAHNLGFRMRDDGNQVIGLDFLRRYIVVFDRTSGKLFFRPSP